MVKRSPKTDPALSRMFGWFMILLALPYAWFAFSRAYAHVDSQSWPTVTASVLSSSMYQRTGRQMDWCMKVSYRYRVQGRLYTGHRTGVSRVGNAGCDTDRDVVQQWMTSLAPGRTVLAYYDPDDPGHAAIRLVGLDAGDYAFCITALLFLVTGGLMLRQANSLESRQRTKD